MEKHWRANVKKTSSTVSDTRKSSKRNKQTIDENVGEFRYELSCCQIQRVEIVKKGQTNQQMSKPAFYSCPNFTCSIFQQNSERIFIPL